MSGFFQTLMQPDREEDSERTIVARAANILQVGEFQLLQLAYAGWTGVDLPEALSDRTFHDYMVRGEVPPWARHYARRIIELDERGELDLSDAGYHRYDHDFVTHVPRGVRQFTIATMALAVFLVGGLLIGHIAGSEATSVLPPYFEPQQLQPDR